MKSIEERAKGYAPDAFDPDYILPAREEYLVNIQRQAYIAGAKDQKAIDEEVRLKKSDDMTKAEYDREVAFADWYFKNGEGTPTFSDAIEWARKDVISKACDWLNRELLKLSMHELKDNFRDNEFKVVLKSQVSDWLIDFRKAMEE